MANGKKQTNNQAPIDLSRVVGVRTAAQPVQQPMQTSPMVAIDPSRVTGVRQAAQAPVQMAQAPAADIRQPSIAERALSTAAGTALFGVPGAAKELGLEPKAAETARRALLRPFGRLAATLKAPFTPEGAAGQVAPVQVPGFGETRPLPRVGAVDPETGEQVGFQRALGEAAGVGLEAGSTLAGGAGVGAAGRQIGRGALGQLARTGARAGAAEGALAGAGESLQRGEGLGGFAARTVGGAALGGAIGSIAGLGSRKISNTLARRTGLLPEVRRVKLKDEAVDITKPVLSKKERTQAIREGRATTRGILRKQEIKPSKRDLEVAEAVADVVQKRNTPDQNIGALNQKIAEVGQGIEQQFERINPPFNESQLRSKLSDARKNSRVIFGGDKTMQKRYDAIVDEYIRTLRQQEDGFTARGAWKARQEFDRIVSDKFPRTFDGSASDNVAKNAILDTRRAVNDFIEDLLPENESVYKKILRRQNLMFTARDNIADQMQRQIGTTGIKRFLERNPALQRALGIAIPAIGGGLATGFVFERLR